MSDSESVKKALSEQNVSQWDIYNQRAEEYEIQFRNFDVEAIRGPLTNSGYAVRVIEPKGKKVGIGIGTGNSFRPAAVKRCLEAAFVGARISEFPGYVLPKPAKYPSVKVEDPKITSDAEAVVKDKAEELMSLLKQSRTVLPTFGKVRTYNIFTVISNSEGLQAEKRETLFYVELALKAEGEGRLAEYWPMLFVRRVEDLHLHEQVSKWTTLAEDTLKAKVPKTAKTTVVFAPQILGEIFPNTVGFHCLASSVLRGISRFKKEEQVGSGQLTVYDDGVIDYALGSSTFDDEGTAQKRTTLIEKGVHKGFLYDAMYAAAFNVDSTGNGQKLPAFSLAFTRVDLKYSLLPSVQPTNISVEPGDISLEEMIATVDEGIYLERLSSSSSDPVTTSFGSEIRNAYLIEKGQLSTPLKGGQVNGFLLDSQDSEGHKATGLLNRVSGISKETKISGRCITPYIRFEGVQIAGK
jgi:predicted Zn-dependent protease